MTCIIKIRRKISEAVHFCTANGLTTADTVVQYYSSALDEQVSPHVLKDSVSALSIGKRIAEGCEFHWTPKTASNNGMCKLIKPNGKEINFDIDEHDVPFLMEARHTAVPAAVTDNVSTN